MFPNKPTVFPQGAGTRLSFDYFVAVVHEPIRYLALALNPALSPHFPETWP